MLTRLITVALSALIGGAILLAGPASTKALADTNVISVDFGFVFMLDLDGLEVDDVVISELTGEARIITDISPTFLDCGEICDDRGFSVREGAKGFAVEYSGDELYGTYTEDHWTIQPYECGELPLEVCPLIMDAPNAFPVGDSTAFMPNVSGLSVGDTIYSTVGAVVGQRTTTVVAITPTRSFSMPEDVFYALPTGNLSGAYVEFADPLYVEPTQDHIFYNGAPKRTGVSFYPPLVIWGLRATYSIVRCTSGGDAVLSNRTPKGCQLVKKWSSRAGRGFDFQRVVHSFTASDKAAGYLRFAVTFNRTTVYSPAYRVNE
jgi:hypothetical protein